MTAIRSWTRQQQEWSSTRKINNEVYPAILIEVPGQAAHRGRPIAIEELCPTDVEFEREWTVPCSGTGNRSYNDLVGASVDIANVVWKTVSVQVVKRRGGASRRQISRQVTKIWVCVAKISNLRPGHFRQRMTREYELPYDVVVGNNLVIGDVG
jgi:hypothetical protein